ncbi:MAG: secondary thiamine-phosphate synthase enzyme [candidate division Zixibacteria bacterium SM23_81]|nr:MAG: secondary thiamine-phosphate synthase enzyme [candidate division Zixibacteria bacterium SM23_81]
MSVSTQSFTIETQGSADVVDITPQVAQALEQSGFKNGIATVFISGSTGGITTLEFEPGLRRDLPEIMDKLIPSGQRYHHDDTWHDGNGHAHLRSSLVGTSFTAPFVSGKLTLGTWQQIVFLDFDNRPRRREILVQLMGE